MNNTVVSLDTPTAREATIPRMTTIRETAEATGMSEYAVRKMVKQNQIVFVKTGTKHLVNFDKFIDFLNGLN